MLTQQIVVWLQTVTYRHLTYHLPGLGVASCACAEAAEVEMTDERWVGACWMRAYWVEVSRVKYWLPIVGRVYPLIVSTSCAAAELG